MSFARSAFFQWQRKPTAIAAPRMGEPAGPRGREADGAENTRLEGTQGREWPVQCAGGRAWRASRAPPAGPGGAGSGQKVIDQLSIRPVSPLALSFTRSFQVPSRASLDRFSVTVLLTLSALPPVRLWML